MEQTGSTEYADITGLKIRRDGKIRKIYGKLAFNRPINNSFIGRVQTYIKTGAGWDLRPFKVEKPVCDIYAEDQFFYPEMAKNSDLPLPMPCPLPVVSSKKFYFVESFISQLSGSFRSQRMGTVYEKHSTNAS